MSMQTQTQFDPTAILPCQGLDYCNFTSIPADIPLNERGQLGIHVNRQLQDCRVRDGKRPGLHFYTEDHCAGVSNKIILFNSSSLYAFDYVHPDHAPEVYENHVDFGLSILEQDFNSQCPTVGWSEVSFCVCKREEPSTVDTYELVCANSSFSGHQRPVV